MTDRRRLVLACVLVGGHLAVLDGQTGGGAGPLAAVVCGNERLGRVLLQEIHRSSSDRNAVVSPISVSLILAALCDGTHDSTSHDQLSEAFGWDRRFPPPYIDVAFRMLLAAFEPPQRTPEDKAKAGISLVPETGLKCTAPEAAWISNMMVHRLNGTFSPFFVGRASKYFGMTFATSGQRTPGAADIRSLRRESGPLPQMSPTNDFVISSGAHLQTVWAGNTFLSKLAPGQFETPSGQWKSVQVMSSEPARYRHAKTDRFEAAVLPCNRAYLVVVLPALGKTVLDVEQDLVQDLEAVDSALKLQPGIIVMPPFRVLAELSLRKPLEGIGVTRIFQDLGGLVNIPRSRLTEVNQRTDIQVNRAGIKADAETVVGGIYGGIGPGVEESFRMELNRPFVFLVRDSITDALLFAGAVVDPTLQ